MSIKDLRLKARSSSPLLAVACPVWVAKNAWNDVAEWCELLDFLGRAVSLVDYFSTE